MSNLLEIDDLHLQFKTTQGNIKALNGISFEVHKGEVVGLVGETGCGKTVTGLTILRLLSRSARVTRGKILLEGVDLLGLSKPEIEKTRGSQIAMIFQDPSTSLNPVFSIHEQMVRVIRRHLDMSKSAARKHAATMLSAVGLPDVDRIMESFPHQLSGGQQQRVMIAMALSCHPRLLIADEPTTSLDVTIQAQILELIRQLQKEFNISVILITHNLGVVAQTCDRLVILYAGRVAEIGSTRQIFISPQHPYSKGLLSAVPRPGSHGHKMAVIPGVVPSNPGLLSGCLFAPRCKFAFERCRLEVPSLYTIENGHSSACFLVVEPDRRSENDL
jgi:peptide/nickel transport system ATP-binding protein